MGRFTVAAALFVVAAMAAVSVAHGGRVLEEGMWILVGTRVASAGNWPSVLDSLSLGDPDVAGAGGPAASASAGADGAERSRAFVPERFGELSINVYEKMPLFGP